jgi:hypothetical protein
MVDWLKWYVNLFNKNILKTSNKDRMEPNDF